MKIISLITGSFALMLFVSVTVANAQVNTSVLFTSDLLGLNARGNRMTFSIDTVSLTTQQRRQASTPFTLNDKLKSAFIKVPEAISNKKQQRFAYIDLLCWDQRQTSSKLSVVDQFPNYLERDFNESLGGNSHLKYASVFHSGVRKTISNIVKSLSKELLLDGLLIKCVYPQDILLGFSSAARRSYIIESNIDPLDLNFTGTDSFSRAEVAKWARWRFKSKALLMNDVNRSLKTFKPAAKLAIIGNAARPNYSLIDEYTTLDNWPTWAASGLIDEIVLEGDWNVPQGRVDYAASKAALDLINAKLLATAKPKRAPVKLTVLIPLRDANGRALDPLSQLLTLQGQGVKSIMLQVSDASDLPRANEFISQTLPSVQAMLQ